MACSKDVNTMLQYDSLQTFSFNLLLTLKEELSSQIDKLHDTVSHFRQAEATLHMSENIPSIDAAEIVCHDHIDKLDALFSELRKVLYQADVETIVKYFKTAPDCDLCPEGELRKFVQEQKDWYCCWYNRAVYQYEPDNMRNHVRSTAQVLREECVWDDEDIDMLDCDGDEEYCLEDDDEVCELALESPELAEQFPAFAQAASHNRYFGLAPAVDEACRPCEDGQDLGQAIPAAAAAAADCVASEEITSTYPRLEQQGRPPMTEGECKLRQGILERRRVRDARLQELKARQKTCGLSWDEMQELLKMEAQDLTNSRSEFEALHNQMCAAAMHQYRTGRSENDGAETKPAGPPEDEL